MTMLDPADTDIGAQQRLLHDLEPVVAENLDRHLSLAKEWHPHDYVPWSRGPRLRLPRRRGLAS